ncbi:hypothetical protein GCM10027056_32640 [Glaciibacter psychrotolerans]
MAAEEPFVQRFRWAFEPIAAVAFLFLWSFVALWTGERGAFSAIILLAAALGISRILPGGALAAGVFSLMLIAGQLVPGLGNPAWALCLVGLFVFFGSSAYGSRAARGVGLTGAFVVSAIVGFGLLASGGIFGSAGLLGSTGVLGTMIVLGIHAVGLQMIGALLVGAWLTGLLVKIHAERRAQPGERPLSGFEGWLMRRDETASRGESLLPVGPSRWVRQLTMRQFAADALIAVLFVLLGFVSSSNSSVGETVVVLGFGAALSVRRLSPSAALMIAWATALLQMGFGLDTLTANVVILAVLYATAAYGGRILKWVGLASVGVGALVASAYLVLVNSGEFPSVGLAELAFAGVAPGVLGRIASQIALYFIACLAVLGLSWTLGLLVRTWHNARQSRRQEARAVDDQRAAERTVVVEQERNRIARDMHDVVAHSLAVVIAQSDGARYARATDPAAVDSALSTISLTAREALADVRILLTQLRQEQSSGPQPVLADLGRLIEQMRGTGLSVVWRNSGTPFALGSGAQLAVYRIIQEALTNALRHGDPDHRVRLELSWEPTELVVTVENAVRDTAMDHGAVGHGVPGMRERAVLAGGTLTTESVNRRFLVTATLPAGRPHA